MKSDTFSINFSNNLFVTGCDCAESTVEKYFVQSDAVRASIQGQT